MNKYISRKKAFFAGLFIFLMFVNLISMPLTVYGAKNTQAVTIRMEKIVGKGTTVTNIAGKKVSARSNMKLYSGYKVATGRKNYVYISLDSKKAIKQDQNSKVQIKKQGSKNEIFVLKGKLFFNVKTKLKSNESMNVQTSSMSMGIRGTSGVVSVIPVINENGTLGGIKFIFQIFDGTGYTEYEKNAPYDNTINGGYQVVMYQQEDGTVDVKKEKITLENIPSFALEEILQDDDLLKRVLKATGFNKDEMKEALVKNSEREEKEENRLNILLDQIKDKAAKNETIIYGDEETNSSSSEHSSSSSNSSSAKEYNLNVDKLSGGILKQEDLKQAFKKNAAVRLITSEYKKEIKLDKEIMLSSGEKLIIDDKIKLINPFGNVFKSNGVITNRGELENDGTVIMEGSTLINSGIVANKENSVFQADSKVKYENSGSLRVFSGAKLTGSVSNLWEKWRIVTFLDADEKTVLKEVHVSAGQTPKAPIEAETRENFTGWDNRYDGEENVQVTATIGKQMLLEYKGMKIGCERFQDIESLNDNNSSINVILMKDYNLAEDLTKGTNIHFFNQLVIDLNGYTVFMTENSTIFNNSSLTIKNSKITGGITANLNIVSEVVPESTEPPTSVPTESPTPEPTESPMPVPTESPTPVPTESPIPVPTESPTPEPTESPMPMPTAMGAFALGFTKEETPYTQGIIVNNGELTLENVKIKAEGAAEINVPFSDYYIINNQGTLLNMSNCKLVLNGNSILGIKNDTGKIQLIDTIIEVNVSYTTAIDLGENSPAGALKASNCRLTGSGDYIIGIKGIGHKNVIENGENVMTFELNDTCNNIVWEEMQTE